MNRVIGLKIDRCIHKDQELYRFHIEFEEGSYHGSCFCHDSFEEAYEMKEDVIIRHYT